MRPEVVVGREASAVVCLLHIMTGEYTMRCLPLFLAVLVWLHAGESASAGFIYSTLGPPPNQFNNNRLASYLVEGSNILGAGGDIFAVATEFTAQETAVVGSLSLALFGFTGADDSFLVEIRADNNGRPGTILGGSLISAPAGAEGIETAALANGPVLQVGTNYWLALVPFTPNSAGDWLVSLKDTATVLRSLEPNFVSGTPGPNTAPAYSINDTGPVSTPEPSSLLTLGTGVLGLFLFGRLRGRHRANPAFTPEKGTKGGS
jgi:hypothetical protein